MAEDAAKEEALHAVREGDEQEEEDGYLDQEDWRDGYGADLEEGIEENVAAAMREEIDPGRRVKD